MRIFYRNYAVLQLRYVNFIPQPTVPSLVEFRGLVSEYWYCRIQTMVSPLKHRKLLFFYRIPQTDFKLCEGIYHPLPLD